MDASSSSSSMENSSDSVFQDNILLPHCDEQVSEDSHADGAHRKLRPRKSGERLRQNELIKKIRSIVRKPHLSSDDARFLQEHQSLVKLVENRKLSYNKAKERTKEIIDDDNVVDVKVKELADLIQSSKHTIVYTGAGISTAANIPDYRGTNGVWRQLNAGQSLKLDQNFSGAIPTYAHMALSKLVADGVVKYIVSQNCDGLHARSGVLLSNLAEIHGNMFAEICSLCDKSYYRVFDVSEDTSLRRHFTKRHCDVCNGRLKDTIVHFGEYSDPKWPHNWDEAGNNVRECDLIICLGTSLKVLRSYKQLWLTNRPKHLRPKLCIINIQWTPKDSQAHIKINGRADDVMMKLMNHLRLEVPGYAREDDPLFQLAVPLKPEQHNSFRSVPVPVPEKFKTKFPEEKNFVCKGRPSPSTGGTITPSYSVSQCSNAENKNVQRMLSFPEELSSGDCSQLTGEEDTKLGVHSALPFAEPSQFIEPPAWFGKGRRKVYKKRGRIKRRRKTT